MLPFFADHEEDKPSPPKAAPRQKKATLATDQAPTPVPRKPKEQPENPPVELEPTPSLDLSQQSPTLEVQRTYFFEKAIDEIARLTSIGQVEEAEALAHAANSQKDKILKDYKRKALHPALTSAFEGIKYEADLRDNCHLIIGGQAFSVTYFEKELKIVLPKSLKKKDKDFQDSYTDQVTDIINDLKEGKCESQDVEIDGVQTRLITYTDLDTQGTKHALWVPSSKLEIDEAFMKSVTEKLLSMKKEDAKIKDVVNEITLQYKPQALKEVVIDKALPDFLIPTPKPRGKQSGQSLSM